MDHKNNLHKGVFSECKPKLYFYVIAMIINFIIAINISADPVNYLDLEYLCISISFSNLLWHWFGYKVYFYGPDTQGRRENNFTKWVFT